MEKIKNLWNKQNLLIKFFITLTCLLVLASLISLKQIRILQIIPFYIFGIWTLTFLIVSIYLVVKKIGLKIDKKFVIYSLIIVLIQCNDYYKDSKNKYYIKEDKSTHINWINIGKAFTKELEFFKGVAALFTANACHTGVFPVFVYIKVIRMGILSL